MLTYCVIFTIILSFCFTSVDCICSFPCAVQVRTKYQSEFGTFQFSCTNSSLLLRSYGHQMEVQECYERNGPFTLLRRRGNEFQCVKEADVQGKITWVYETPFKPYFHTPTICSMCSPALMRPVPYVSPGVILKYVKKLKPPPIGCNIPRNCPILDYRDIPCTGCEPVDDGSCCVGCKPQLPELFGPYMSPYMHGGGMFSNMNGPSHRPYGYRN